MEDNAQCHYTADIFNSFSYRERKKIIKSINVSWHKLEKENEMFENFRSKITVDKHEDFHTIQEGTIRSFSVRFRSMSSTAVTGRSACLNAKQKCTVAQSVIDEIKHEIQAAEKKFERIQYEYKVIAMHKFYSVIKNQAILQATDVRLSEVRKNKAELSELIQSVILAGRPKRVLHDAFTKFQQDQLRKMQNLLQKFKADNLLLKSRVKLLTKHFKEKVFHGESTANVNIEDLRIRCKKSAAKFHRINCKLARMKIMCIRQTQLLDKPKRALERETEKSKILRDQIQRRLELTAMTQERISRINEFSSGSTENSLLKDYRIPTASEFIDVYLEAKRLSHIKDILERKLNFGKMNMKMHKRMWSKVPKL
ncbi:hypothetical protein FGIG_03040 [Fasciola gigantica]|uniref:Coiled-coil domain-containing protein n=1 Tax=Fasciola gigantica TaxID=46835 RepID=A0A504YVD5_FASGI|nr:hypothetical protein FGIG_03040 [Fasciola gigantica]